MRPFGRKIHWPTKLLSNKNYISEVSIDGKKTNKVNFLLGHYDLYASQVMRAGNCLTLLSSPITFSVEHFKNGNLLDDIVKYVFWTFNENFLRRIADYLSQLTQTELQTLRQYLENNPAAYQSVDKNSADEELIWCLVKNEHLKVDPKFAMMYQKDTENREAVLEAVISKMNIPGKGQEYPIDSPAKTSVPFLDMLNPQNDDVQHTLQYIQDKIMEAKFPHNIFKTIEKTKKGNNQTGLNSAIAAMVYVFQQKGYFKNEFTFKEIFKAFGMHSGNSSGKDYDYNHFKEDYSFEKYLKQLQSVNIEQYTSF